MADAVVAGLIPTLHCVVRDESSYYFGRHMWFGFLAMYGLVIYMVQTPLDSIFKDFRCHENISDSYVSQCFEAHVSVPVRGIWYMFFSMSLAVFFLLEVLQNQIRHWKTINNKSVKKSKRRQTSQEAVITQDPSPKKPWSIHLQNKPLLLCSYYFLQLVCQSVFAYQLLYKQLPLFNQHAIYCGTPDCPRSCICMFKGSQEKITSICTVLTLCCMMIIFCCGFLIYTIRKYFKGNTSVKVAVD